MRQIVIATHTHLAAGLAEAVTFLAGEHGNVRVLNLFVDGEDDVAAAARPSCDDLVVCTDLLGGSVNNEFAKLAQIDPRILLVTNANLPVVLQLVLAAGDEPTVELVRQVVSAEESRPVLVNDLLVAESDGEDEF